MHNQRVFAVLATTKSLSVGHTRHPLRKKDIVGDKHGDIVKTKPMYVKFIKMNSLFYKEMVIDVASF